MKRTKIFSLVFIFFVLWLGVQARGDKFTPYDAKELAINAAALIETKGLHRAREILLDPDGDFMKGQKNELYAFVLNFNGDLLVHPRPDLDGRNALDWKDQAGNFMVKEMISMAKRQSRGWVKHLSWDPKTDMVRPKATFVVRIGDSEMLMGSGIYMDTWDEFRFS